MEFIVSITGLDEGTDPVEVKRLKPLTPVGVVGVSPTKKKKEKKWIVNFEGDKEHWYIYVS